MKSHGILSRYLRPGFEEGGTYDDKKRAEIEKKWKIEKSKVKESIKGSRHNLEKIKDFLHDASQNEFFDDPYFSGYLDLTKYADRDYMPDVMTLMTDANNIAEFYNERDANYLRNAVSNVKSIPMGVKELSPTKKDIVALSDKDIEERQDKDFREAYEGNKYTSSDYWKEESDPTYMKHTKKINLPEYAQDFLYTDEGVTSKGDTVMNPSNYIKAINLNKAAQEAGMGFDIHNAIDKGMLSNMTDPRADRYINAATPDDYEQQQAVESYNNEYMDLAGLGLDLASDYYKDKGIAPTVKEGAGEPVGPYGIDSKQLEENKKMAKYNASGIMKIIPEFGAGLARMVIPVNPNDILKYNRGEIESWWDPEKGADPNWGINDSMLKDFEWWDKASKGIFTERGADWLGLGYNPDAPSSDWEGMSWLPGWSNLWNKGEWGLSDKDDPSGAGHSIDSTKGWDKLLGEGTSEGMLPDEDAYDEYWNETPDKVKKFIMESAYEEAMANEDFGRADRIKDSWQRGEFPNFLDYSDFSRANVKWNVPGQVIANIGPLAFAGRGKTAAALVGAKGATLGSVASKSAAAAAAAKKAAIAAKLAKAGVLSTKIAAAGKGSLIAGGMGIGSMHIDQALRDDPIEEVEDLTFEEDFYDPNVYRNLPGITGLR
jgi:hypothetical protein